MDKSATTENELLGAGPSNITLSLAPRVTLTNGNYLATQGVGHLLHWTRCVILLSEASSQPGHLLIPSCPLILPSFPLHLACSVFLLLQSFLSPLSVPSVGPRTAGACDLPHW